MQYLTLAVFAALGLVTVWACAPVSEVPVDNTSSTQSRKKRDTEEVEVTIVTTKNYDKATITTNLKLVKDVIDKYQKEQGININFSNIENTVENKSGKFAVTYFASDKCKRVKNFVKGAKASSKDVSYALLKCGEEPVLIL